jgi:two-component system response regulator (stage 0 sporulation protein F)
MKKILIVEDEIILKEVLKDELTDAGYEVYTVSSGKECLEFLEKNADVSLIIMDIKLPDISGLQLLEKISQKNYNIPIVMCTAYDSFQHDYQVWLSTEVSKIIADYIVKPVDLEELRRKVKNIIG